MKLTKLAMILATFAGTHIPKPALAYDMDCAVILCMAGGFPGAECQPPFNYMIARITRFPHPLPPFGPCTFEGATGAISTLSLDSTEYAWLSKMRIMWWSSSYTHKTNDGDLYSWQLKTCTADNACHTGTRAIRASTPPPKTASSDNGELMSLPGYGRFIGMEYSTYDGRMLSTDWMPY